MTKTNTLKQQLIKGFMGVGALKLLSIPISLVTSIVLARLLGSEAFGQYSFIMALLPLLALPTTAGLGHLLTREVAQYTQSKSWGLYRGLLFSSYAWVICVSLIIIILVFMANLTFPSALTNERWALLKIAALSIPFLGLETVRNGTMRGLSYPVYAQIPGLTIKPLLALLGIFLLYYLSEINSTNAIKIQVIATLLSFLIATAIFVKIKPSVPSNIKKYETTRWLSSLLPFSLIAVMFIFNTQIGIVILGFLGTNEDVASMRVAERGAQFVTLSLTITNLVIAPQIAKTFKQGDTKKLQNLVKKSARAAFLIALPLAAILIAAGQALIHLLYGAHYADIAYVPLAILAAGQLFNVFCGSVGSLLSMSGFEKKSLIGHIFAITSNIVLCAVLIPKYGAIGAAIGISTSLIVWNIILTFFVIKHVKVKPFAI